MKLIVATCQFPVDADIQRNTEYVLRQMRDARARSTDVAHFPEACLSGYAGVDFATYHLKTMEAQVGDAFHKYNPASTLPGITMPAAMHAAEQATMFGLAAAIVFCLRP